MSSRTVFMCCFLILLSPSFGLAENGGGGDAPYYIPASQCNADERKLILEYQLPLDQIHTCRSRTYSVEGREVTMVAVEYGEALGCSAGCIYQNFPAVLDGDKLYPMPAEERKKDWLVSLARLPTYKLQGTSFSCNYPFWQTITRLDLEWNKDTWGWRVSFTEPLVCKWIELPPVDFVQGQGPPDKEQQVYRTWEGSMFVSGEPGDPHWVYDKITVHERRDVLRRQGRF